MPHPREEAEQQPTGAVGRGRGQASIIIIICSVIIHPQAGAAGAAAPRRLLPLVRRQDLRAQAARPLGPGQRWRIVCSRYTVQYLMLDGSLMEKEGELEFTLQHLQVSCDWWTPGHVTPCSPLIGWCRARPRCATRRRAGGTSPTTWAGPTSPRRSSASQTSRTQRRYRDSTWP